MATVQVFVAELRLRHSLKQGQYAAVPSLAFDFARLLNASQSQRNGKAEGLDQVDVTTWTNWNPEELGLVVDIAMTEALLCASERGEFLDALAQLESAAPGYPAASLILSFVRQA